MLRDMAPLFVYMRRYRWGYLWGTLSCVATNIVAVQFPRVLGWAIDKMQRNQATREATPCAQKLRTWAGERPKRAAAHFG